MKLSYQLFLTFYAFLALNFLSLIKSNLNTEEKEETQICGGFIEIDTSENPNLKNEIDLSSIVVRSFTTDMIMKEQTNVAQSGYYFLPIYEKESIILSIVGPNGMKFEPEQYVFNINEDIRIDDICKDDNNFKFRGYTVEGQISTFGTFEGPEGVAISLIKVNNDNSQVKLQDAITLEGGSFLFNPVYPGKYLLKPTEKLDEEKFDPKHKELLFNVVPNKQNYLEKALIVRGYQVSGSILSDEKPAMNVLALIYSFNATLISAYECKFSNDQYNKSVLKDLAHEGMLPFCASKTDSNGKFTFQNIPFGHFLIKPYFNSAFMKYEIVPQQTKVEIFHKNQVIETPFIVESFSITGKVVNHKRNGIPNVNIKVDGLNKAVSDSQGFYTLRNLVSGHYDLEAHTEDMYFEPIQNIHITSLSESLPDFIVKDYKLCGKIHIETADTATSVKRAVLLKEKETNVERRTVTDITGRYCFEVKPSAYHIQPLLSQEEKDAELHLTPESIDVEVIDQPRLDINFYQSKVEVTGLISCINNCHPDMKIFLTSLKKSERVVSVSIEKADASSSNESLYKFTFNKILSGQYKLSIQKFEWCWDQEEIIIRVQNQNISDLKFHQVGYSLFFATQYNIKVNWVNTDEPSIADTTMLKKTESKVCLPKQGIYKIFPKSCHKFDQEYYIYDTSKKERLHLTPTEFLVNGSIALNSKVTKELTTEEIGFLKLSILVEEIKPDSLVLYKKIENIKTDTKTTILFNFYTKSKTNLLITPEISSDSSVSENLREKIPKLLFYPKFKQIRVEESCSENYENLKFDMRSGLIINGRISPAMDGVKISAYNKDNSELISSTESLSNGEYKIGPLYTEFEYDLKAVKDGYKIWATNENKYVFNAEKLSFLRVKIVDTSNKPLSSVFLSLSSSNRGFKINNNTNSEGYFDFLELYSGEYYIKPLFKEYKFDPSQKMVTIVGGEHYEEVIVAHRVAFSIYGKSKHYLL